MKIILIVHQFFPEYSSGTEVLTYQTAKELQKRGHDVEVLTAFPADPQTARERPFMSYQYDGLPVLRYNHNAQIMIPNKNVMEFLYYNLSYAERFREHVRKSEPDLVHAFHFMRSSISTVDVCLGNDIPIVFTPTDFWAICILFQLRLHDHELCSGPDKDGVNCIRHLVAENSILPGWVKRVVSVLPRRLIGVLSQATGKSWWPEKKLSSSLYYLASRKDFIMERINKLDRVIVPARFMESMLIDNGLNRELTSFVPFGLNLEPFADIESRACNKPNDPLVFGYIGTLLEHKGVHVLLEAAKLIPKDIRFKIKIYGRLEEKPSYTQRLKALADGDERIEFCGTFPNDRIAQVLSGLDALVVPSIWYENTPLVIYSAHAAKVPVIGTNLGGISEVVHHGKCGLLFERGDHAGLSELMKRVIENRALLGRLVSNLTPPLSIPAYVDKVEEVYAQVLEKRISRLSWPSHA